MGDMQAILNLKKEGIISQSSCAVIGHSQYNIFEGPDKEQNMWVYR